MRNFETVWTFKTARFTVALEIEPEDLDPADSFEFQEDIDAVRNGDVEWFCAAVSVYLNDDDDEYDERDCVARDYLGGCAYKTVREFYTAHRDPNPMNRNSSIMRAANGDNVSICHYFPGMVTVAIAEARKHLCNVPKMRCA